MRHLHLMRHAKSSWDDPDLPDEERPLAPRGRRAARRMAQHVEEEALRVELVLCSPARRARDTLELVLEALGPETTVTVEPRIYGAEPEDLLELVRSLPEESHSALVVGHNPGIQAFAHRLARADEDLHALARKYPTGALASLALDVDDWREAEFGRAGLRAFVRPRDLG